MVTGHPVSSFGRPSEREDLGRADTGEERTGGGTEGKEVEEVRRRVLWIFSRMV